MAPTKTGDSATWRPHHGWFGSCRCSFKARARMPERRKPERCRRAALELGASCGSRGAPCLNYEHVGRRRDGPTGGGSVLLGQRGEAAPALARREGSRMVEPLWARGCRLARTGRPTWLVSAVRRADRIVAACRHACGRGGSVTVQASASSGRARGTRSRVRSSYGARARQRDPRGASTSGRDAIGRSAPRHSRRSALQRRPDSFRADVRVVRSRAGQRHRPRRAERHDPTARPHRVFTCSTASARSSSRRRRI